MLLLSVGPDLPWLTGYEAMPLERLTMLVLPRDGDATLVVPRLEAPRVVERPEVFALRPWDETDDPVAIVADLVGAAGDGWRSATARGPASCSTCRRRCRRRAFGAASEVVGPLRAVKDAGRGRGAAPAAAEAVDRVAAELQAGDIPLVGRTEAEVSADLGRRIVAEGHQHVNFAIVAAGENAASPHHEAGDRVIAAGRGRAVRLRRHHARRRGRRLLLATSPAASHVGEPPAEVAEAYAVLHEAQRRRWPPRSSARRARRSTPPPAASSPTPATATGSSTAPATASASRSTRTPTSWPATPRRWPPGHAFSVEPGIYVPGRFGPAPGGHRRRHRRRPRRAQPGRPRAGRRRRLIRLWILVTADIAPGATRRRPSSAGPGSALPSSRRDPPRRRHRAAAVGRRAGCCSCGSRPAGARSASATAGCCAAPTS